MRTFLFYIAILTAAGVSTGVRALRAKQRTSAHRHPWDLGLASLLLATSVGMAAFGLVTRTPLFAAFSVIGFLSGGGQLAYWLRPPTNRMHWWFEHMTSMLGSSIAATTAFLVVNADRLGASNHSLPVWLAPTILGPPAIVIWTTFYRRRFGASEDARYESAGRHQAAISGARRDTSIPGPAAVPYMPSRTA